MNYRKGDIVHVRAIPCPEPMTISVYGGRTFKIENRWYEAEKIVHVEPRPFKVGDRVKCDSETASIMSLDSGYAWIKVRDGYFLTARISELQHADQE